MTGVKPALLKFQEIHASICKGYFLPRRIHARESSGLHDFEEPVQFEEPHSAYEAACWVVVVCASRHRQNNAIVAHRTILSHVFNDVPPALAVSVIFAATKRTGAGDGEI